jgi:hypothetical protein
VTVPVGGINTSNSTEKIPWQPRLTMATDVLGCYKLALSAVSIMQQVPLVLTHCSPSNTLILTWFPLWLSTQVPLSL